MKYKLTKKETYQTLTEKLHFLVCLSNKELLGNLKLMSIDSKYMKVSEDEELEFSYLNNNPYQFIFYGKDNKKAVDWLGGLGWFFFVF